MRLLALFTVLELLILSLVHIFHTTMFKSVFTILQCFLIGVLLMVGVGQFFTGSQSPAVQDISTLSPFQQMPLVPQLIEKSQMIPNISKYF